jgi:hypothetical protein
MSWHYYCWALGVSGSQAPYDPMKKAFCDNLFGPMVFNTAVSQARKIGGGQMMTEVFSLTCIEITYIFLLHIRFIYL